MAVFDRPGPVRALPLGVREIKGAERERWRTVSPPRSSIAVMSKMKMSGFMNPAIKIPPGRSTRNDSRQTGTRSGQDTWIRRWSSLRTCPLPRSQIGCGGGNSPGRLRVSTPEIGRVRRTLDAAELGDWVDRLCQVDGPERLARYREQAEQVADAVGTRQDEVKALSRLIGAALGSQQVRTSSRALAARQASLPYDQDRLRLFAQLAGSLRESATQSRPVRAVEDPRYTHLPFFEA